MSSKPSILVFELHFLVFTCTIAVDIEFHSSKLKKKITSLQWLNITWEHFCLRAISFCLCWSKRLHPIIQQFKLPCCYIEMSSTYITSTLFSKKKNKSKNGKNCLVDPREYNILQKLKWGWAKIHYQIILFCTVPIKIISVR